MEALWTVKELAEYLGYTPATVTHMASQQPHRLPPRVATLSKPRWSPDAVRAWINGEVATPPKRRNGRPRSV